MHIQTISKTSDEIIKEAKLIVNYFGEETFIKIPVIKEGLKAIKILSDEGYRITATAIYSIEQAFLAGEAGAYYVAPYVNRIEKIYGNGIECVEKIDNLFKINCISTKILAASFKRVDQVLPLAEHGINAATLAPNIYDMFMQNSDVEKAVDAFITDFESINLEKKTMLDYLA